MFIHLLSALLKNTLSLNQCQCLMTVLCVAGTEKFWCFGVYRAWKKTAVGCGKGHSFRHQVKCKGEQKSGASLDCCAKMSMRDAESQFEIIATVEEPPNFSVEISPKRGKQKKTAVFFPGPFRGLKWYLMITERKFPTVLAMCWFHWNIIGTSHMGKGFRIPIASCPTSGKRWSCIAVKMPYSELEVYWSCHCVSEMR